MKREYIKSDELKTLGEKIIVDESIDLKGAIVGYLLVEPYINKTTAGRCMRTNSELNYFSGFDYIIEMSSEVWNSLNDNQKYVLMLHELMHIYPVENEKSGEINFSLKDHDVKDFRYIINKYGIDWISDIKTIMSSVFDLKPEDADSINI